MAAPTRSRAFVMLHASMLVFSPNAKAAISDFDELHDANRKGRHKKRQPAWGRSFVRSRRLCLRSTTGAVPKYGRQASSKARLDHASRLGAPWSPIRGM